MDPNEAGAKGENPGQAAGGPARDLPFDTQRAIEREAGLRNTALNYAVDMARANCSGGRTIDRAEEVVTNAELYLAFIKGAPQPA